MSNNIFLKVSIFCSFLENKKEEADLLNSLLLDTDDKDEKWLKVNQRFSEIWPNITMKKDSPTDAKMYESEENKYDKYFSEKSGG